MLKLTVRRDDGTFKCQRCGKCCPDCSYLMQEDNGMTTCAVYEIRPKICRDHTCETDRGIICTD